MSSVVALLLLVTACTVGNGATIGTTSSLNSSASEATNTTRPSVTTTIGGITLGEEAEGLLVTGPDGGVRILDERGEVVHVLSNGFLDGTPLSAQPTASPNGRAVIYTNLTDGVPTASVWTTSGTSNYEVGTAPFYYDWNPPGDEVLILGNLGGGVGVQFLDVRSGEVTRGAISTPHYLAWSPDGSSLASHRDGTDLIVSGPDVENALDVETAIFQAPDWLDGNTVVVATTPSDLVVSNVDVPLNPESEVLAISVSGAPTEFLVDASAVTSFAVSPDRARLAVLSGSVGRVLAGELLVVDVATGESVSVSTEPVLTYQWSPDSSRLLFGIGSAEEGTIQPGVWNGSEVTFFEPYRPTSLFLTEYLPFWGQYVRHQQPWSPTSDAFAYAMVDSTGTGRIMVQPIEGGEPVDVADGSHVSWMP